MGFVLQGGWTPLGTSSEYGHLEIVKSLIEAGANVNHTTEVVENKFVHFHTWVSVQFNECLLLQVCVDCDVHVEWNCILCLMYVQYVRSELRAKWGSYSSHGPPHLLPLPSS